MKIQRNKSQAKRRLKTKLYSLVIITGISVFLVFFLWFTDRASESSLLKTLSVNSQDGTSSILQKGPTDFAPLSCPAFLQQVKQKKGPIQDPNNGHIYSRRTLNPPYFQISLHNEKFDRPRWSVYERGYYYETALTEAFSVVLNATTAKKKNHHHHHHPTTTRVLDVGGNIGYFTLLAAAHGDVTVDTFEPNLKNNLRLCESLQLNHWPNEYERTESSARNNSHVNCHPYGVGREDGTLTFREETNPGQGQFSSSTEDGTSTDHQVRVVTLDSFAQHRGWFESRPDIAIFKIDVEGYEANVMHGARKLLKSHLIRNIFMEVSARTLHEIKESKRSLHFIASAGYDVYQYGGFRGPKHVVNWSCQNVTTLIELVIHEVTKKKHPQLNLWWKLAPS